MRTKGVRPFLDPLPRWEVSQISNILRTFERGGRKLADGISTITQASLPGGLAPGFEQDDEPGRPEQNRLSNRGLGTLLRTDPVYLNLQKTRLLDPTLNHLGSNDKGGDYRSSGCTACHTLYANDRDPAHSADLATAGNQGVTQTVDPTIQKDEPGHPVKHIFTKSIPSSQCVVCHMHPGTSVTQSYYGYMWWDNELAADKMYPKEELNLSAWEKQERYSFNVEGAVVKGLWGDPEFLQNVTNLNDELQERLNPMKFADFHGHGWVYRSVLKKDKYGQLLDKDGKLIEDDDKDRWSKSVHLKDIHLEKGMHCVDCHFEQDNHGDGKLYGAMRNAIEIDCRDCHGTAAKRPTLKTTGPAAPKGGHDLSKLRTPFGKRRFQWKGKKLFQRSNVVDGLEWEMMQTVDTVMPGHPNYNERSALAKTIQKDGKTWGDPFAKEKLAHPDSKQNCYSCHTSWMTSCFGCHLPMKANERYPNRHSEGTMSRNYTPYSFMTLRDDVFMIGKDDTVQGGRVTHTRSACAVYVGSQNQNREWIYSQQQTISAEGFSGQAFAPSFAHTVRSKESRQCTDCHVSAKGDNNAWMAMVLMQGNNAYNFFGRFVYVGEGSSGVEGIVVSERDEPQAITGSYLHKYAYPSNYKAHVASGKKLTEAYGHSAGGPFSFLKSGEVLSVQHRGEYLYAACGKQGLRLFDIANIDNKGFSQRITSAPVSPIGQNFHVDLPYATSVASPTTLGVDPTRQRFKENEEGPIHLLYAFLYVTDLEEGLVLVLVGTLLDGDPTNNYVDKTLAFNPGGQLTGARFVTIVGNYAYVLTKDRLVVVDLSNPLQPKITAQVKGLKDPRQIAAQFRYAWVADADGVKTLDITDLAHPKMVEGALAPVDGGAQSIYVMRTWAYVAAKSKGIAIVNVERPEKPKVEMYFDGGGKMNDVRDVKVGINIASWYAYVAGGDNGFHVVQLTSPDKTKGLQGFIVKPTPELIATYKTKGPALCVEEGIDRDRAVDESGNQLSVFGRIGSRPLNLEEMQHMYLRDGKVWTVTNDPPAPRAKKFDKAFIKKGLGEKVAKPRAKGKKKKKRRRRRRR